MIYEQGNLLESFKNNNFTAIAHQCNLVTTDVAGIAKVIFNEFPNANKPGILNNISNFGNYAITKTEYGDIINLYSQYYPGSPTFKFINDSLVRDDFTTRLRALRFTLSNYKKSCFVHEKVVLGIPLLASGLAADHSKKLSKMTDLDYFRLYIEPIVKTVESENFIIKIMYL